MICVIIFCHSFYWLSFNFFFFCILYDNYINHGIQICHICYCVFYLLKWQVVALFLHMYEFVYTCFTVICKGWVSTLCIGLFLAHSLILSCLPCVMYACKWFCFQYFILWIVNFHKCYCSIDSNKYYNVLKMLHNKNVHTTLCWLLTHVTPTQISFSLCFEYIATL